MEYTDEEVAFAFRLLNERETLDDREVEEWMKSPAHRRLMNDLEGVRQQWEADAGDEQERAARAKEEERGRKMTLRWAFVMALVVATLLIARAVAGK